MRNANNHSLISPKPVALSGSSVCPKITMSTAAIRRRPHAFTLRHQLIKMSTTGIGVETSMSRWIEFANVRTALQVSKDEAKATINITLHAEKNLVMELEGAVKKYGMIKGPLAHSGLASNYICLGSKAGSAGGMAPITSYYTENCVLDEKSCVWMAKRMIDDWIVLPPGMRKAWTSDTIGMLHLKVTAFGFAARIFQTQAGILASPIECATYLGANACNVNSHRITILDEVGPRRPMRDNNGHDSKMGHRILQ
jgi:hypothetical protein